MWFGTFDGLNRFNGYEYKIFRHDPFDISSLSANIILAIHEDHTGSLWIGTSGGGLNRFDTQTEKFTRYSHDPDNPHSLGSDVVYAIYQDRNGVLWVAQVAAESTAMTRKQMGSFVTKTIPMIQAA